MCVEWGHSVSPLSDQSYQFEQASVPSQRNMILIAVRLLKTKVLQRNQFANKLNRTEWAKCTYTTAMQMIGHKCEFDPLTYLRISGYVHVVVKGGGGDGN